jgi:hypothetical protein
MAFARRLRAGILFVNGTDLQTSTIFGYQTSFNREKKENARNFTAHNFPEQNCLLNWARHKLYWASALVTDRAETSVSFPGDMTQFGEQRNKCKH